MILGLVLGFMAKLGSLVVYISHSSMLLTKLLLPEEEHHSGISGLITLLYCRVPVATRESRSVMLKTRLVFSSNGQGLRDMRPQSILKGKPVVVRILTGRNTLEKMLK